MKPRKVRLDALLLERGLAESLAHSRALILAGQVVVDEQRAEKPGAPVQASAALRLKNERLTYVSRGGLKLKAAVDHFQLRVRGTVCADIGASTGGFTDCLLQEGAARVYAVDVGYGLLHEKLRVDPRVLVRERVNARHLSAEHLPELIELMTVDVSFISLTAVLPAALQRLSPGATLVCLVKPQFEAAPERVEAGGVVRDEAVRRRVVDEMARYVSGLGLAVQAALDSPIAGPAGNREALLVARTR